MVCYITSLICKDFLFGPKKNVAFKVLSGPITIVFLFFCQQFGVVTVVLLLARSADVSCVFYIYSWNSDATDCEIIHPNLRERFMCRFLSQLTVLHVMLQDFQSHLSLSGRFICFTDYLSSMCFRDASFLSLPVIISWEGSLTLEQIPFLAIQFPV